MRIFVELPCGSGSLSRCRTLVPRTGETEPDLPLAPEGTHTAWLRRGRKRPCRRCRAHAATTTCGFFDKQVAGRRPSERGGALSSATAQARFPLHQPCSRTLSTPFDYCFQAYYCSDRVSPYPPREISSPTLGPLLTRQRSPQGKNVCPRGRWAQESPPMPEIAPKNGGNSGARAAPRRPPRGPLRARREEQRSPLRVPFRSG